MARQIDLLDLEPGVSKEEVQAESEHGSEPPDTPQDQSPRWPARESRTSGKDGKRSMPACPSNASAGCGKETVVIG
jgi:hypothetical protein